MVDSPAPSSDDRFEVFFDGGCPLCRREIDMIRKKDRDGRLRLTDISDPGFRSDVGSRDQLMRAIHGRGPGGEVRTGVDVFREIYSRLGWRRLVGFSRLPVIRGLLDWVYRGFAWLRYHHALRRDRRSLPSRSSGPSNGQRA